MLEVETLDAEQITHLIEHGSLPDRPAVSDESNDIKVNISIKKDDEVNSAEEKGSNKEPESSETTDSSSSEEDKRNE